MKINTWNCTWIGVWIALFGVNVQGAESTQYRRLPVSEYRDKMKAGWIGQIAGVSWGAPTEFKYRSCTIGEEQLPKWQPGMINNAFDQDDLYVEMTFLRSMEQYGLDCSIRQAGIDFANSRYDLACANNVGRENMRKDGIAPPDSGHPNFNKCSTDIDYQIEADFSGLIAPGMPNVPIAMGDLDETMKIACQCGEDSDCNPSSAGGVLFATLGYSKLPERFTKELDEKTNFSFTAYNFPKLLDVCEKLARQAIVKEGGKIEKNAKGEEFFLIPVKAPKPSKLELAWAPGPIAGSKFTEAEMAQITVPGSAKGMKAALDKVAPGWSITNCNSYMDPGLRPAELGRKNVLATYPKAPDTPCVLSRKVDIPAGKNTTLKLSVGHHPLGDWDLVVKADAKELLRKPVGKTTATNGWLDVAVDLSEYKGKSILLELINQPTDWNFENGYWEKILIESK